MAKMKFRDMMDPSYGSKAKRIDVLLLQERFEGNALDKELATIDGNHT